MRVLITGGTGFVGAHTARALLRDGHRVRLLVRDPDKLAPIFGGALASGCEVVRGDMTDGAAVGRALDGQEAVVHAAALVRLERKHAAQVLAANRAGAEQVIGAAVARGVGRIVHVSSAVVLFQPGDEGASAYMRSKAECERYVRELQDRGAPIRTTYPGGVFGPDDPGLSESNRGLVALVRDATVVTAGGLQLVDVRDVAAAHARLLGPEVAPGPGRHSLAGHFLRWGALADLLEEVTGRRLRRVRVPAPILRAAGTICDLARRVHDFELPLTREGARIMTEWTPLAAEGVDPSGIDYRDPRATLRDTLAWLHRERGLAAGCVGACSRAA
jgi:nucleoside-diphosphate-sugar epimerase